MGYFKVKLLKKCILWVFLKEDVVLLKRLMCILKLVHILHKQQQSEKCLGNWNVDEGKNATSANQHSSSTNDRK